MESWFKIVALRFGISIVWAVVLLSSTALSQSFSYNGAAAPLGGNCLQLTPAVNSQAGSIWTTTFIDLSVPFDLRFQCFFGNQDANGADGMAFVLQNGPTTALGNLGGGMGFQNLTPSLCIQFDTYQNSESGDPSFDHLAITRNGTVEHSCINSIVAPVQASSTSTNIEDGQDHEVQITWNPNTFQLQVFVDCVLRINTTYNIAANVFSGNHLVRWGWTAGTGGLNNLHRACLVNDTIAVTGATSICPGDSTTLSVAGNPSGVYSWTPTTGLMNPTSANPVAFPLQTTTYVGSYIGFCGEVLSDSIVVEVLNASLQQITDTACTSYTDPNGQTIDTSGVYTFQYTNAVGCDSVVIVDLTVYNDISFALGPDTDVCEGDTYLIDPGMPINTALPNSYLWQDGSTSATFSATTTGLYWVEISNHCYSYRDTIELRFVPPPTAFLLPYYELCYGDSLTFGTPDFPADFLWSTGSTSSSITVGSSGIYHYAANNVCTGVRDTAEVYVIPFPEPEIGNDTVICEDEFFTIYANNPPDEYVLWQDGSTGPFMDVNASGTYWLQLTNKCGNAELDSIQVLVDQCECDLWAPNAFTPNGDLTNDYFLAEAGCDFLSFQMEIFDRWGKLVFSTTDPFEPWNGEVNGQEGPMGIYVVRILYTLSIPRYSPMKDVRVYLHLVR